MTEKNQSPAHKPLVFNPRQFQNVGIDYCKIFDSIFNDKDEETKDQALILLNEWNDLLKSATISECIDGDKFTIHVISKWIKKEKKSHTLI